MQSTSKPYRWMSLRCYSTKSILQRFTLPIDIVENDDNVWHVVVHECQKSRPNTSPIVCTSYFSNLYSEVMSVLREKFEMLELFDEDDPNIIEAALQDEETANLLQKLFESGDTINEAHFKTVASLNLLNRGKLTLLLFCCEHGYIKCISLLLEKYSTKTEPKWLRLADPMFQEKSYGNSAFHVAVYRGDEAVFRLLWQWALDHGYIDRVKKLKSRNGENLADTAERRIKMAEKNPAALKNSVKQYVKIFNVLASAFNREPKDFSEDNKVCTTDGADMIYNESVVFVEHEVNGETLRDPYNISRVVSLGDIVNVVKKRPLENDSVLILSVHLTVDNLSEAAQFVDFFARCHRLAWESAYRNGIPYADGFRYLPDGFLC